MSWYYIDSAGTTQGPVELQVLKNKWGAELTPDSYVWNGTSVNQWSLIKDTELNNPGVLSNNSAPKPQTRPAPKPKPAAGRGKAAGNKKKKAKPMNLLDAIRKGKAMKKVGNGKTPDEIRADKMAKGNYAKSTGAAAGGPKKKGGKLTLQEQLAARLKKPKSSGGPAKKSPARSPSAKKKEPAQPKKKTWGRTGNNANKSGGFLNRNKQNSVKAAPKASSGNKSSESGDTPNKNDLKKMIDNCNDDWVLKAIEKLLQ